MTVKVRQETLAAGPDGVIAVGTVRELDEAEAGELVEGGYASYVDIEDASLATPEKAVLTRARKTKSALPAGSPA